MTGPSLPVLLAVALVAPAQAPAAITGVEANATAKRVVVSPRPGQLIRANRVRLRVRARNVAGALAARLNGVPIGADFGRSHKGVRTLRASVSHGLRRGKNVLRVRVREWASARGLASSGSASGLSARWSARVAIGAWSSASGSTSAAGLGRAGGGSGCAGGW